MGKVILVCGKICSGKSYYSKQLKDSLNAVIISPDEATYELINNEQGEFYNVFSERLNKYLTRKVGEIAKAGANVIFERGLWSSKDIVHNVVVNANIFKVKSFLNNLVSVNAFRSVNAIRLDVALILALICQHPLRGMRNEFDLYKPSDIVGIAKQLVNEIVNILGRNPNRTELYTDLRSGQILRLHFFKSFHIDVIVGRKLLCRPSCKRKFLSHVARKVFVCHQIFAMTEHITMLGIEIDHAL